MSPSNFSTGDPDHLGSILFNPGGPGDSGVDFVLEFEPYFRAIIGPQYDLVGFDPRGVGETTPALSIFNSPAEAEQFYKTYPFNVNESVSSFGRFYAQAQILGDLALNRAQLVAESVGTAAVATDMLNIARALGQEKLNYWGISYGSILGATFAAMFPDNVGRLIIDGVSDSHQWYFGETDTSSLLDTDAGLTTIYEACVAAGPSLCAVWENSTDLVRARVDNAINAVHIAPLPLFNDTNSSAITFAVVDYSLVVQNLFQAIYMPFSDAPVAAEAIVALEQGNGSLIYQGSIESAIDALDTCASDGQPFVAGILDTVTPILCGDSIASKHRSFEQARADYEAMLGMSSLATEWYPITSGTCTSWPIQAKDLFNGTFDTNTSTPILLIGNTFDPVTPIQSARNMSAGFAGSVVLQQNSTGHTSLSGFSTCTALAIRAYFQNGTLPAPGTVCETDTLMFQAPNNSSGFGGVSISARDAHVPLDLREAERVLRESTFLKKNWFRRRM
ncbi:uncharacterized protein PHACADRAFT_263055 [Phanerochaete carnosa HHB-10118-sp]|uniref:Peptidase S33 tripeptidyl aminopeptidase-like C-terminal domain-containing protein n=1 Tax=Phanerochaete carnosa (strain HHB-10118-sp) TaxID=650164 RepID=K5VW85_PHACS|nr:uncharacterized protein PHACADRAFT_263055 [Phanerochaete carnosa HHB-10118-sp]EKM51090.1 hypothetical protein PHACADRAFT_263055 [Phanerochaete carnosa HHB-10118-sp]